MIDSRFRLSVREISQPDWPGILAALGDADLDSPRRSTVPLVAYWQNPIARLTRLQDQLGFPPFASASFSFEHPVNPSLGRGKPSYTDLMILTPTTAIAIEGKYTEAEYEKVHAWLHDPRDQNRCDVLRGWLNMLEMVTGARLTIDSVLHLPYQLVHRAASACFQSTTHRAVVYQVFDAAHRQRYLDTLQHLRILLATPTLKLGVFATPASPTRRYSDLLACWDAGERRMAREVRSALLDGQAFTFAEASLFRV
jgi:hypothetical protein